MKSTLLIALLISLQCFCSIKHCVGQGKYKVKIVNAEPVPQERSINNNIKINRVNEDLDKPVYRSAACKMMVKNKTWYTIDIFIDGAYESTIGANNDISLNVEIGVHSLYGITIGGSHEWHFTGECSKEFILSKPVLKKEKK